MRLKIAPLLLSAVSVATMSAQAPTAPQDIYSQTGSAGLASGQSVVYSFGSWHAADSDSKSLLWGPLFDELIANSATSMVEGVAVGAEGFSVVWNSVDKTVTVGCDADKIGRTSVLIASMDGATRGVQDVKENPAVFSLADYQPGVYAIAVAVDGKLIKTLKITLK